LTIAAASKGRAGESGGGSGRAIQPPPSAPVPQVMIAEMVGAGQSAPLPPSAAHILRINYSQNGGTSVLCL